MATAVFAEEATPPTPGNAPNAPAPARRKMPAPPVYAPSAPVNPSGERPNPENMTPEQRADFEAARKRRFDIMVLINAYKIMPQDQREPLRVELLKRIKADFEAVMAKQKARIAQAEADLERMRREVAEQEAHADELIQREMDRLLNMPTPGNRK